MSVASAWRTAMHEGLDRLDAQALLGHVLGLTPERVRAWLLAHDTDPLPIAAQDAYQALVSRRAGGEPLAYLVGEKEFFGLALQVSPDVLVPRPDTEIVVEWALECLHPLKTPRVLDLGTGSGAIALAIKRSRPDAEVTAVDLSEAALAVARANAQRLGLPVRLAPGFWWGALPDPSERFELVVSNPPYIPVGDEHLPALRHEPALALASGADGLDDIRSIVSGAPARLEPGGWLLLEHGYNQSSQVQEILQAAGLFEVSSRLDLAGHLRCTGARRPVVGAASTEA
jgi:release factor glutamine methyltransferase